jgi:hypothetical protein
LLLVAYLAPLANLTSTIGADGVVTVADVEWPGRPYNHQLLSQVYADKIRYDNYVTVITAALMKVI